MPIERSFNDPQILVQRFHGGTSIDAARRPLFNLFSEPLPMRADILEGFTIFQAQIAIHNQLQRFTHNEIRRSNCRPNGPTSVSFRAFAATATSRGYHFSLSRWLASAANWKRVPDGLQLTANLD
jgi:hypothetical protein